MGLILSRPVEWFAQPEQQWTQDTGRLAGFHPLDGLGGLLSQRMQLTFGLGRSQEEGAFGNATGAREPEGTEAVDEGLYFPHEDGVGRHLGDGVEHPTKAECAYRKADAGGSRWVRGLLGLQGFLAGDQQIFRLSSYTILANYVSTEFNFWLSKTTFGSFCVKCFVT